MLCPFCGFDVGNTPVCKECHAKRTVNLFADKKAFFKVIIADMISGLTISVFVFAALSEEEILSVLLEPDSFVIGGIIIASCMFFGVKEMMHIIKTQSKWIQKDSPKDNIS